MLSGAIGMGVTLSSNSSGNHCNNVSVFSPLHIIMAMATCQGNCKHAGVLADTKTHLIMNSSQKLQSK